MHATRNETGLRNRDMFGKLSFRSELPCHMFSRRLNFAPNAVFDELAVGADLERFEALHQMPFGMYGQFYGECCLFERAVEGILRRSSPG